ncbi:MAG TPA: DUF6089 family protein [Arachidicoccus sp.]
MIKKFFILLISIPLLYAQLHAQSFGERTSLGFFGGISQYHGSMSQTLTRSAAGINLHYEISDKFAIRFQYTASETGGSDSTLNNAANNGNDTRASGYYFRTNLNEFTLLPEYNFFNINEGAKFTPYVFAGIAVYNFKPYQIEQISRPNGTFRYQNIAMQQVESFSNWQMNVPIGLGFKYAITPNFIINAEGNYRFLFNKYIDNYIADNKKDSYYTFSLGISFRLSSISVNRTSGSKSNKDCKCPPVY